MYSYKTETKNNKTAKGVKKNIIKRDIDHTEYLRAVVSNYRESVDSCKNSNFFFFHQKIPLGKLFSKTTFKCSSESPVLRKIEKFEI